MHILSHDELLGTSIADQSTRMQDPLWELRRVMMFNRTTIVIIVSVGEETDAIRRRHDDDPFVRRNERRRIRLRRLDASYFSFYYPPR